jgi:hypothetical protein
MMKQGRVIPKRQLFQRLLWGLVPVVWLSLIMGCATPSTYRVPISRFNTAVNETIATVQPYFIEMNKVETEYQLYSAIKLKQEWGTQHLQAGLDPQQIALRVAALQLIADHARLLADIVDASPIDDIKEATVALGVNAQSLATAIAKLDNAATTVPDFGTPLGEITALLGKQYIEHMQTKAIETAVLKAEEPLSTLLDMLEQELQTVVNLRKQAIYGIATVRLDIFNEIQKSTKPEKIDDLVQEVVGLRTRAEKIASVNVVALFRDLKAAHKALVRFVKSDKKPTDLSSFVASVSVFADNAAAVSTIIQSLQKL